MKTHLWTALELETLRLLCAQGLNSRRMSSIMAGRSQDAICGVIYRKNIPWSGRRVPSERQKGAKKGCTRKKWHTIVSEEAKTLKLNPAKILARSRKGKNLLARYTAWRKLVDANFSIASIAQASGFHHTTVLHGLKCLSRTSEAA